MKGPKPKQLFEVVLMSTEAEVSKTAQDKGDVDFNSVLQARRDKRSKGIVPRYYTAKQVRRLVARGVVLDLRLVGVVEEVWE